MPWSPEERDFLRRVKTKTAIADIRREIEEEIKQGLRGFIGRTDTPKLRAEMQNYADDVCRRYNTRLRAIGYLLDKDIAVTISIPGDP